MKKIIINDLAFIMLGVGIYISMKLTTDSVLCFISLAIIFVSGIMKGYSETDD